MHARGKASHSEQILYQGLHKHAYCTESIKKNLCFFIFLFFALLQRIRDSQEAWVQLHDCTTSIAEV